MGICLQVPDDVITRLMFLTMLHPEEYGMFLNLQENH